VKWSHTAGGHRHILGMAQGAEVQSDVTGAIVARIIGEVRAWRIVLFGSRARGDATPDSDWDIYLEVDAPRESLKEIRDAVYSLLSGFGVSVDTKVARAGEIERRQEDPGTIEWDVAREGLLLYSDPAAPTTLAPPRRIGERPKEPPESMHEWIEAAERDLRLRELVKSSNENFSPEICWLSHQTCEKIMKALLVARHVRPKRTHDLGQLLSALRDSGCALTGLDDDCRLLTKHAITPRYPAGNKLGIDDARTAFAAAERVVSAVRAELPPRLH
jgi:HEPN domain-containing protein/predicted nucleotidyltransferase